MEREPEHQENVKMPKFCPECGGETIEKFKVPTYDNQDFDETKLHEEHMNVCTMCEYEEPSNDDTLSLYNSLFQEEWRSINNALPDVTLLQTLHVESRVHVLGHHPFPNGYIYVYNTFLLAEVVVPKRGI